MAHERNLIAKLEEYFSPEMAAKLFEATQDSNAEVTRILDTSISAAAEAYRRSVLYILFGGEIPNRDSLTEKQLEGLNFLHILEKTELECIMLDGASVSASESGSGLPEFVYHAAHHYDQMLVSKKEALARNLLDQVMDNLMNQSVEKDAKRNGEGN